MPQSRGGFAVPALVRFSTLAVTALGAAREEIDALNVYPVPDGDTGTNLFLTFEAGHETLLTLLVDEEDVDLATASAAYTRGLLLGARGNSGVILSQLVGALFKHVAAATEEDRSATVLAEALTVATEAGYAAVGRPVEGTVLSVARAASEAATSAALDPRTRSAQVLEAAARAARSALARTPDQLAVLADAGVVDAGGRGLCLVLDAGESAFTGRRELRTDADRGRHWIPIPRPAVPAVAEPDPAGGATGDGSGDGPAYEVMYLLDAADPAVPALRSVLATLGDSLVVVGGDGLWNVHVHVDDVGAAIEAGVEAGRPHRIRVTHFADQRAASRDPRPPTRTGRAVVALASGAGLAAVLREAGAVVLEAVDGRRPSTGELLAAIRATGAAEVVVLPNDGDVVPTAEAAARIAVADDGLRAAVVPTRAQVQGMAALAVHEPGRAFDQDLVEMTAAARHARTGAVSVAVRRAMTSAGPCEPGDVLGSVEDDFTVVGQDLLAVGVEVLERLLGGGGELVTVLAGGGKRSLAERCAAHVRSAHPSIDVLVYDGGQRRDPLLFGVE